MCDFCTYLPLISIATDIQKLIEHLGEKQAIIVGHDMGGKAAYVIAHIYPESVSKLVLADCLIPGRTSVDTSVCDESDRQFDKSLLLKFSQICYFNVRNNLPRPFS